MGIEDMVNQAKDAVAGAGGSTDDVIDKAAEAAKDAAPDQADPAIDKVADEAKKRI